MNSSENTVTPTPAHPGWWLAVVSAVQLLFSGVLAVGFALEDLHEPGVMVFWGVAWCTVLVIGVFASVAAVVRAHRIRARVPSRLGWLGMGVGALTLAHWIPMLLWSPVAFFFSLVTDNYRTDGYLVSALAGLIAWVIVTSTAAMMMRARRRLAQTGEVRPYRRGPALLAEWIVAGVYAAPIALVAGALIADGGDGGGYGWSVIPALLGSTLIIATPVAWAGAAADMVAARFSADPGDWRWSFVGRLAALLALVAAPLFAFSLLPAWDDGVGQRFGVQMATVVVLATATWVIARWRLPVGSAPAPG